jgi:hypothetical protein
VWGAMKNLWLCNEKQKQENIVANALLRAHDIQDTNVLLCPNGEDITFVASTNDLGKVWTIHALTSKWSQCDCPLATQDIVYKHVMKIFKMFHPNIGDGSIVKKIDTLHKVTWNGPIPKDNSFKCKLGNDHTKDDDTKNEQLDKQLTWSS